MPTNDLRASSYEYHYSLLQHYSSLLFKGRVSVVTVCVLIWAYVLGVVKDVGAAKYNFLGLHLESQSNVALGAMFLLLSFMSLELAYARRLVEVIASGQIIEREIEGGSFFSRYSPPTWSPMLQFYLFNELGLAIVFVTNMWSMNGVSAGIAAAFLSVAPFLWIIRSYRQSSQWVEVLVQPETKPEPNKESSRTLKGSLKVGMRSRQ